jgi:hypothetical protein
MQGNVCAVLQKIVPGSSTGIFGQVLAILLAMRGIGGGCAPEPCDMLLLLLIAHLNLCVSVVE